jgi:hypothetical protein
LTAIAIAIGAHIKRIIASTIALSPAAFAANDVLVFGTTVKVTDLDPASAYDQHIWDIFQNIDGGLLSYEPGSSTIGRASPRAIRPTPRATNSPSSCARA